MAVPRWITLVGALCALAACVPATPEAPPPQTPPDTCKSAQFQRLIGQSRGVLTAMTLPAGTRIIGPRDAVTMDLRPDRLNFETDADDRIAKIGCY